LATKCPWKRYLARSHSLRTGRSHNSQRGVFVDKYNVAVQVAEGGAESGSILSHGRSTFRSSTTNKSHQVSLSRQGRVRSQDGVDARHARAAAACQRRYNLIQKANASEVDLKYTTTLIAVFTWMCQTLTWFVW